MTTTSASTTLPVPSFADVKFQKEDVGQVMTELPSFNFYEMKESLPNHTKEQPWTSPSFSAHQSQPCSTRDEVFAIGEWAQDRIH